MNQDELRPHIRDEQAPGDAVVVLRGCPDTLEKLAGHARRTNAAYCLDGDPVRGVSVFAALDDVGPASLDALLAHRLVSYRLVHTPTAAMLIEVGSSSCRPSAGRISHCCSRRTPSSTFAAC